MDMNRLFQRMGDKVCRNIFLTGDTWRWVVTMRRRYIVRPVCISALCVCEEGGGAQLERRFRVDRAIRAVHKQRTTTCKCSLPNSSFLSPLKIFFVRTLFFLLFRLVLPYLCILYNVVENIVWMTVYMYIPPYMLTDCERIVVVDRKCCVSWSSPLQDFVNSDFTRTPSLSLTFHKVLISLTLAHQPIRPHNYSLTSSNLSLWVWPLKLCAQKQFLLSSISGKVTLQLTASALTHQTSKEFAGWRRLLDKRCFCAHNRIRKQT